MTTEEQMIISALRYALPRRSYIMSTTEEYIRKFIDKGVSEAFLTIAQKDIEDHCDEITKFKQDIPGMHDWNPLWKYITDKLNNPHI